MNDEHGEDEPRDAPGVVDLLKSVIAAAFGVQSSRNRERDFARGNYRHFVLAGIVFTVLFVLTVAFVVRLVLRNAGM